MWVILPLFQAVRISQHFHNFPKRVNSDLVTSSDSSLRTNRCISAGPMDLCAFTFLRGAWEPHLVLQQMALHSPNPCFCLLWLRQCGWSTCWWRLRQKNSLSTSVFSISWITRSPIFFWRGLTFSLVFITDVPVDATVDVVLDNSSQT